MNEKKKKNTDKLPPLTVPPDPSVPNRAHTQMSLGNFEAEVEENSERGKRTEGNFGK